MAINIYDYEADIRKNISKLFTDDPQIERTYKKIRQGVATFEDASLFSKRLGELILATLGKNIGEIDIDELAIDVVMNYLDKGTRISQAVCESIQTTMNDIAGTGIKPIKPSMENRKNGIKSALEKTNTNDEADKLLKATVVEFSQSYVDEWIKTNAEFQKDAGMRPIIVRRWDGTEGSHDTRHTDKCKLWQGTWEYGEQPSYVFKRHQGCGCTVEYFPNRTTKGQITALAKGEKDTEEVLWNTGKVFSNSREAELARRRRKYGKEKAREILNEEWKGGRNGQAERHF